jgi:phosphonate transport system ATP-binding protein
MARTHFARIVGLRDGRIVFDLPREDVTDAMIAALYENESIEPHPHAAHEPPERIAVGACF